MNDIDIHLKRLQIKIEQKEGKIKRLQSEKRRLQRQYDFYKNKTELEISPELGLI